MKKLIFALIFAAFLFGCKSEDNNDNDNTDTVVVDENNQVMTDTIEIYLTDEEIALKSDEILQRSEEINSKLDDLLNNL